MGKRQKTQVFLASETEGRGEAPDAVRRGTEAMTAKPHPESPAEAWLMEEVVHRENLWKALKRVKANGGAPGVDDMTVQQLPDFLRGHWSRIREKLLAGTYQPQPVRRVEIPKPDGGTRQLGIPTALDRFLQQAVLQVLQRRWDRTFSDSSYGFRPGRSVHQAVAKAQSYIQEGFTWVVDLDLEKFFDRVNHDVLMGRVAKRISDTIGQRPIGPHAKRGGGEAPRAERPEARRLLKLIRGYLEAGVMEHGLIGPRDEGTPQGGPLSPLLSNLLLDELDRELERRGHRFVRYADDCIPPQAVMGLRVIPSWISPPPKALNFDCTVWSAIRSSCLCRNYRKIRHSKRCNSYPPASTAESGFNQRLGFSPVQCPILADTDERQDWRAGSSYGCTRWRRAQPASGPRAAKPKPEGAASLATPKDPGDGLWY